MLKPTLEAATICNKKSLATGDRCRQEREHNGHISGHLFSFYFLYVNTHRHKRLEKGTDTGCSVFLAKECPQRPQRLHVGPKTWVYYVIQILSTLFDYKDMWEVSLEERKRRGRKVSLPDGGDTSSWRLTGYISAQKGNKGLCQDWLFANYKQNLFC